MKTIKFFEPPYFCAATAKDFQAKLYERFKYGELYKLFNDHKIMMKIILSDPTKCGRKKEPRNQVSTSPTQRRWGAETPEEERIQNSNHSGINRFMAIID